MIHEQRVITGGQSLYNGLIIRFGQRLFARGQTIQKLSFPLLKVGAPTGDVTFTVRKLDDTIILSKVLSDASAISDEIGWYEVIFDTPAFVDEEVRILVEFSGGIDAANCIAAYVTDNVMADEKKTQYIAAWADSSIYDAAYSYTYEPCISVAASADDCYVLPSASDLGKVIPYVAAGYQNAGAPDFGSAMRFLSLPIPPGANVLEARLRFRAFYSLSNNNVNTRIRCQKAINPPTFSTYADFAARTWTTEYINWDAIGGWTAGEIYISPDFKTPLQEVVDQVDYQVGDALVVLWDDFEERSSANDNTYRAGYSFDGDPDKSVELYVRFEIPPPSYRVYIDWEDDALNTLYGNVSRDVIYPITWEIGKNEGLGRVDAGTAELHLTNHDYKYSPEYASSPLFGYVRPGKMVTITAYANGIAYPQYYGRINEIVPHPHPEMQEVYLYLVDDMDILATARINLPLYEDQRTGYLIGKILDAAGWDADKRQIALGSVAPNFFYASEEFALDKIHELEDLEGGLFYVDRRGYAVWDDRYYRQVAPQIFSQYTVTKTTNIDYKYSLQNIINVARGTYIIQTYQDTPFSTSYKEETYPPEGLYAKRFMLKLASSGPSIWVVDYEWNVEHIFAAGRYRLGYYWGTEGTWYNSDATVSLKGHIATVHFNSVHCVTPWLCSVVFEGFSLEETGGLVVEVEDATSITEYGRRHYYIDIPLSTSEVKLRSLLKRLIARNKDVRVTDMPISLVNYDEDIWVQLLERHISDKITLQNVPLGIDGNYFINKVIHSISSGNIHETTWILEKVVAGYYWTLGLSQLGVNTRLGH